MCHGIFSDVYRKCTHTKKSSFAYWFVQMRCLQFDSNLHGNMDFNDGDHGWDRKTVGKNPGGSVKAG